MQKVERLLAITLLLQARGRMTAHRLSEILEVSPRTIYRDMDALSLAHVPVSMQYGPGGGYFLADGYHIDPTTFTRSEAIALAVSAALAGSSRLFDAEAMRRALVKVESVLPEEYRDEVRAAGERILLDPAAWHHAPSGTEHLDVIQSAVWAGKVIDLFYRRADRPGAQWRRVEPLGLVIKSGIWYLVAYCRLRQDFRTFRLSRVTDAAITEELITPRPEFNLQAYWEEMRDRFEKLVATDDFDDRLRSENDVHPFD